MVSLKKFLPSEKEHLWRYSLVLLALGIEHEVKKSPDFWEISVKPEDLERAQRELEIYETENRSSPREIEKRVSTERTFWTFLVLTALLSLNFDPRWQESLYEKGVLDAALIRDGQWWRLFTSLFLHQDPPHLLGNMLFGGIFFSLLLGYLPWWRAWCLVLLSGIMGNFFSFLLHSGEYRALGFSTAVFGEVGLLAVLGLSGTRRKSLLLCGFVLAFLGFLGSAGENVDLVAHLCGAFAGVCLGMLVKFLRRFRFSLSRAESN